LKGIVEKKKTKSIWTFRMKKNGQMKKHHQQQF